MLTFAKPAAVWRRWSRIAGLAPLLVGLYGCDAAVSHFAFFPDNGYRIPDAQLPADVRALTITTADEVAIQALYLPRPGAQRVLIYFHGNAGNIYHRIPALERLRRAGVAVVGVSYRGYAKSAGSPSETGIYRDGEAVFRYVTGELDYAETNVILLGRSVGSAVAVNVARDRPVNGLILVTPMTSGKAVAQANGFGVMSALAGNAFDNLGKIARVHAPVLVVHGSADRIVPFAQGRALYDAAPNAYALVSINGAGHNNLQGAYADEYWPPIEAFIRRLAAQ